MKRILVFLISFVVMVSACGCAVPDNTDVLPKSDNASASDAEIKSEDSVSELAQFESETLDGEVFTAENFADYDITVVNFWATWCQPCINEIPSLEKLSKEYGDKNVNVVGILFDSEDEGMIDEGKNILEKAGAEYTQLRMSESAHELLEEPYKVQSLPTTFFVDTNGNVVKSVVGANTYEDWCSILNEVLK